MISRRRVEGTDRSRGLWGLLSFPWGYGSDSGGRLGSESGGRFLLLCVLVSSAGCFAAPVGEADKDGLWLPRRRCLSCLRACRSGFDSFHLSRKARPFRVPNLGRSRWRRPCRGPLLHSRRVLLGGSAEGWGESLRPSKTARAPASRFFAVRHRGPRAAHTPGPSRPTCVVVADDVADDDSVAFVRLRGVGAPSASVGVPTGSGGSAPPWFPPDP